MWRGRGWGAHSSRRVCGVASDRVPGKAVRVDAAMATGPQWAGERRAQPLATHLPSPSSPSSWSRLRYVSCNAFNGLTRFPWELQYVPISLTDPSHVTLKHWLATLYLRQPRPSGPCSPPSAARQCSPFQRLPPSFGPTSTFAHRNVSPSPQPVQQTLCVRPPSRTAAAHTSGHRQRVPRSSFPLCSCFWYRCARP